MDAADLSTTFIAIADGFRTLDEAGHLTGRIGLAVSGGSDSTALAVAAHRILGPDRLFGATVDHRLRHESGAEARQVGEILDQLSIPHEILIWKEGPAVREGSGNLANMARAARHRLLGSWGRANGLSAILLGHTMDDQAETVLLRLQRGSGIDGLSAMDDAVTLAGTTWLRPLLKVRREALRDLLRRDGIGWSDDPSNDDPSRDRIRIRQAINHLGLSVEGLAATATRLNQQRRVIEQVRTDFATDAIRIGVCGEIHVPEAPSLDTTLAVFADAIRWVGGTPYRPRHASLMAAWESETVCTLAGCQVSRRGETRIVSREHGAVPHNVGAEGPDPWDRRWHINAPGMTIGALGEFGLGQLKSEAITDQRWHAAPRAARLSTPGLWDGNRLVATPLGRLGAEKTVTRMGVPRLTAPPARFSRCRYL